MSRVAYQRRPMPPDPLSLCLTFACPPPSPGWLCVIHQASSSSHEAPLARPSSPAPPLSDDDAASVEEHGLVLAIQVPPTYDYYYHCWWW